MKQKTANTLLYWRISVYYALKIHECCCRKSLMCCIQYMVPFGFHLKWMKYGKERSVLDFIYFR